MYFENPPLKSLIRYWERFKRIFKVAGSLLTTAVGYLFFHLYKWEPYQQVLQKKDSIEGLNKLLSIDSLLTQKLTELSAIFFFVLATVTLYFWRNQDQIAAINHVMRKLGFILKLPASFCWVCWFFVTGMAVGAYQDYGTVGIEIFALASMLFLLPALIFTFSDSYLFFKPIAHRWQEILYPWFIGALFLFAVGFFLYTPISFFLSLRDWYEFIQIHWSTTPSTNHQPS